MQVVRLVDQQVAVDRVARAARREVGVVVVEDFRRLRGVAGRRRGRRSTIGVSSPRSGRSSRSSLKTFGSRRRACRSISFSRSCSEDGGEACGSSAVWLPAASVNSTIARHSSISVSSAVGAVLVGERDRRPRAVGDGPTVSSMPFAATPPQRVDRVPDDQIAVGAERLRRPRDRVGLDRRDGAAVDERVVGQRPRGRTAGRRSSRFRPVGLRVQSISRERRAAQVVERLLDRLDLRRPGPSSRSRSAGSPCRSRPARSGRPARRARRGGRG